MFLWVFSNIIFLFEVNFIGLFLVYLNVFFVIKMLLIYVFISGGKFKFYIGVEKIILLVCKNCFINLFICVIFFNLIVDNFLLVLVFFYVVKIFLLMNGIVFLYKLSVVIVLVGFVVLYLFKKICVKWVENDVLLICGFIFIYNIFVINVIF